MNLTSLNHLFELIDPIWGQWEVVAAMKAHSEIGCKN
jgi:hypothetical protein